MVEEIPPEFKFSADDQDPESFYHEEIKDMRVEKLSQRITLISILLPILIGVALFFAYRDLTGRVIRSQDTGSVEAQRISRELEEFSKKFNEKLITFSTTLSSQDKDFNTTVSGKLASVNKNVDVLNKNLKSLNENLTQTRKTVKNLAASKADKKNQTDAIAKVNANLESLKKELKSLTKLRSEITTVSAEIKILEGKLSRELAEVATTAAKSQKNYSQLQTSIKALAGDKIDRDTFDLEMFKLKKNYDNRLVQEITAVNQKLNTIQKTIDDIQKKSISQKKSMKSLSKKTPPAKSTGTTITGTTKATTSSKSGSIDEQDLLE
jgi:DNA repair exonuclease SbcCD ATPase subunit